MSVLVSGLEWAGAFLGVWVVASIVATIPLVLWFRAQALSNDLRSRAERRRAFGAAAHAARR